uniref:BZIP domain-containing protein n=1 Tax=Kalanchoe fedtschenkoi TaxID=63787 RepID=A0A7N0ZSK7_KALFE
MGSSSGASSGLTGLANPFSAQCDPKKRKRMESNRESARRSRLKKQKHLHDLVTQLAEMKNERIRLSANLTWISQLISNVELENSVLRTRAFELTLRLESLNEILNLICTNNNQLDFRCLFADAFFDGYLPCSNI